jgi:hypothetical protein
VPNVSFGASVVELDPVEHATGWGSHVVAIPKRREAWFSRYEKTASARLYRFEIETRKVEQIKGLAGELRGAVLAGDESRLLLLATFAVQELNLGTMQMSRTLRAGVGKYLQHFHALDSDHLGLARMGGRSLAVLQLSRWAIVRRLNIAAPDLICQVADRFVAYSFYNGAVTWIDRALQRGGNAGTVPLCLAPVVDDDMIFALAAEKRPLGRDIPIDRIYNLAPTQEIKVFELTTGRQLDRIPLEIGIDWIHGIDGQRRLVLSHDRQLILFDPRSRTVAGAYRLEPRHPVEARVPRPSPHLFKLYDVSLAGSFEAVVIPDNAIREVWHVSWAGEAPLDNRTARD